MTMLLLAVLGWSAVSVVVAGLWAAVCAGARRGAALDVAAWQRPAGVRRTVPADLLPRPRSAAADQPVRA